MDSHIIIRAKKFIKAFLILISISVVAGLAYLTATSELGRSVVLVIIRPDRPLVWMLIAAAIIICIDKVISPVCKTTVNKARNILTKCRYFGKYYENDKQMCNICSIIGEKQYRKCSKLSYTNRQNKEEDN